MKRCVEFFKRETVLCIACLLALISSFLIPPDKQYVEYVDFRTLGLLFCLMTVMAGLQKIRVFELLAQKMLGRVRTMGQLIPLMLLICFVSSMVMTNDVALITFVPFTFTVLAMTGEKGGIIPVTAMQTIAANLGSMLTPIGNPQNLYLYGTSGMSLPSFLLLMLPFMVTSGIMLLLWSFWFTRKNKPLSVEFSETAEITSGWKLILYLVLFLLSLLTVARVLDYRITLGITLTAVLAADRKTLRHVDYSLLMTFVGFFVFIGNMGRLPAFRTFLESVITGREAVTAVLSSQCISNVPAALMLSGFTENYPALIVGVNLGGLGTLIASMASLISFKFIARDDPAARGKYLLYFTLSNLAFLAVLLLEYFLMN